MKLSFSFTDALVLSAEAFRGRKDSGGVDYVKHGLHVAHMLKTKGYTNEYQILGLLHDVPEDTDITVENIRHMGASESMCDALDLMTHVKNMDLIHKRTDELISQGISTEFAKIRAEEEEYMAYIRRLSRNDLARVVKIEDLDHNSQTSRIKLSDLENFDKREHAGRRTMKYAIARHFLTGGRVGY